MNGRSRLDWIQTALKLAFNIADYRSQDPNNQVGACLIKHDGSIVLGYNGGPPGIEIDWDNREEKRQQVIHAEMNVLDSVKSEDIKLLALTHLPCEICLKLIAKKRIKTVYYCIELPHYNCDLVKRLAKKFEIELIQS